MALGRNRGLSVNSHGVSKFGEDRTRFVAAARYEGFYCAWGDKENVLKQQVLDLPGARMSTHELASNQLRLWLATLAYLLLERVRTVGAAGLRVGDGDGGDDSHAAAESGGASDGERAAGVCADEFGLSVTSFVSPMRGEVGGSGDRRNVAGRQAKTPKRRGALRRGARRLQNRPKSEVLSGQNPITPGAPLPF